MLGFVMIIFLAIVSLLCTFTSSPSWVVDCSPFDAIHYFMLLQIVISYYEIVSFISCAKKTDESFIYTNGVCGGIRM